MLLCLFLFFNTFCNSLQARLLGQSGVDTKSVRRKIIAWALFSTITVRQEIYQPDYKPTETEKTKICEAATKLKWPYSLQTMTQSVAEYFDLNNSSTIESVLHINISLTITRAS